MIFKHTLKLLLTIFLFSIITSVNADYIKKDRVILKVNDKITLQSKIKEYKNIILLLSTNKYKINKIELKNKILNEIAIIDTYNTLIKKYNFKIDKNSLENLYKDTAQKKYIFLKKFKKLITEKYNLNDTAIKSFIISSLTLNKIIKTNLSDDIILSNNDVKNFFNFSNYKKYTKPLFDIKIMQISIKRKHKNSNKELKELLYTIKHNQTEQEIYNKINKNVQTKTLELNSKNKIYFFLKDLIPIDNKNTILGPIYINNYIYVFKVLEKKNKTDDYKPHIKIKYKLIKKKIFEEKNNNSNSFKIKNTNYENFFKDKSFKTYWINKENTDQLIYEKAKKIKINETSNIIETNSGWYIIQVLDKTFDKKSNIYNYIMENIFNEKIKLLNNKFEEKIKRYITTHNYIIKN